jgi:amidase
MDARYFTPDYGGEPDLVAVAMEGIKVLKYLGAVIVEVDTGDPFVTGVFDAEFMVLLTEFKPQIAEYLGKLRHTRLRSLADLIAFNIAHCPKEMPYYGQEIFELSDSMSGDLTDPDYLAARALCLELTRTQGIDKVMAEKNVEAIISPSYSFGNSPSAVAGYPDIAIPVGLTPDGRPAGLWMCSGYLREPTLLAYAYDLEQELRTRQYNPPRYLGTPQPYPPDPGLCTTPLKAKLFKGKPRMHRHLGTGKLFRR